MSLSIAILLLQTPSSQCLLTAANWIWEIRGESDADGVEDNQDREHRGGPAYLGP